MTTVSPMSSVSTEESDIIESGLSAETNPALAQVSPNRENQQHHDNKRKGKRTSHVAE